VDSIERSTENSSIQVVGAKVLEDRLLDLCVPTRSVRLVSGFVQVGIMDK